MLGEAQHDPEVRTLLANAVVLSPPVHELLVRLRPGLPAMPPIGLATDEVVGPVLSRILMGREPLSRKEIGLHADGLLKAWSD